MWFKQLMGFAEESPEQVRAQIEVSGTSMKSLANGRVFTCGVLETPSLGTLRERVRSVGRPAGKISLRQVVANVQHLHSDPANAGALFQVASQFNLLEMTSPTVTPEAGVDRYEHDHTQGPACAMAAGAGTIYRNYFVPLEGQVGQSAERQIDCLADLGAALGNDGQRLWQMQNGYALASHSGLLEIGARLRAASEAELDALRARLRIGVHWRTQVTLPGAGHLVSQAFCSALPLGYSDHSPELWQEFARLVLEATYEATVCAAILNALESGNNRAFMTLVGGGVFRNDQAWILAAIRRALALYPDAGLDVAIVSYGAAKPEVQQLAQEFQP